MGKIFTSDMTDKALISKYVKNLKKKKMSRRKDIFQEDIQMQTGT